jgi:hypothetical protein
VTSRTP